MEAVAPELSKEDVERLEAVGGGDDPMVDVYQSQLEKSKSIKVASAQNLVDKALKDPKVIKQVKKTEGRGRGRGRGRGKPRQPPQPEPLEGEAEPLEGEAEPEPVVEGETQPPVAPAKERRRVRSKSKPDATESIGSTNAGQPPSSAEQPEPTPDPDQSSKPTPDESPKRSKKGAQDLGKLWEEKEP